ncbi:MAG: amidohydrolase family protein [Candidatus Bathyarchaeia archaeon]|jgi:cytosine/adenosine deaminase-related metal-dependent hydrolase
MRSTLVTNLTILAGGEFQRVDQGNLLIENGRIRYVGQGRPDVHGVDVTADGQGLLAIPGLINAHTHVGDSVAKDLGVGKTLNELVHPLHGIKTQLLANESPELIRLAISQTASDMLNSGITTFVDFREGGLEGIQLARQALNECRQRVVMLCRPKFAYSETQVTEGAALTETVIKETKDALSVSDGIGLSGANEYTKMAMEQIGDLAKQSGKPIAIHAAESLDAVRFSNEKFQASEIQRIFQCMTPSMIVHGTHTSLEDVRRIAERNVGVVCCPRANASLGVGFPPISTLLEHNVRVALGTDNVMLNAPDMFREMDYAARMIKARALKPSAVSSIQILKMSTINAADILGLSSSLGTLDAGKKADVIFLDLSAPNLSFSRDLVTSIVHRARPDNIMCVMIDGEIVHGSLQR